MNPGDLVSHYRIVQKIGEGGMGEVYIAQDETLKRRVALKSIRKGANQRTDAHTRFAREARVLSQLDHPHICRIFDYISTDEGDVIVLELIEGRSFTRLGEGLKYAEKLALAEQIASALVAAHAEGIVHRDLKPGNIMLTPAGGVKVLDFGLACVANSDDGASHDYTPTPRSMHEIDWNDSQESISGFHTEVGHVFGTVQYMAPEQATGEDVGPAADMFSFGLILQEIFTGELPRRLTKQDGLARAAEGFSAPVEGLPSDLTDLITRLKERAPTRRPTALEAQRRLRWIRAKPQRRLRAVLVSVLVVIAVGGVTKYTLDLMAQRAQTEEKRKTTEAFSSFMLGKLHDLLDSVQLTEGFEQTVLQALDYYSQIPRDSLLPDEIENYAQAWIHYGRVRTDKDKLLDGLEAFNSALALLDDPRAAEVPEASNARLRRYALYAIGRLNQGRGEPALAERAFLEVAALAQPSHGVWKDAKLSAGAWKGMAEMRLGELLLRAGRYDEARGRFSTATQSFASIQQPAPEERYQWAQLEALIGTLHSERFEYDAANGPLSRQLEISLALAKEQPSNKRWQQEVAFAHTNLGSLKRDREQNEAARLEFERAIEAWRALTIHDPSNLEWKNSLADVLSYLSKTQLVLRHVDKALDSVEQELELREMLTEHDTDKLGWLRTRAICENNMGDVVEALHGIADARDWFKKAVTHSSSLVAAEPTNNDFQLEHTTYLRRLGMNLTDAGELEEARKCFGAALEILRAEPEAREPRVRWLHALAQCRINLANLHLESSELGIAELELNKSSAVLNHSILSSPNDLKTKEARANLQVVESALLNARGQKEEARAEALSASETLKSLLDLSFLGRRARYYVRAIRIASGEAAVDAIFDAWGKGGYAAPADMKLPAGN